MPVFEIIGYFFGAVAFLLLMLFVWESNKIIAERNKLRKETGKYYDFDIVQELKRRENERQTVDGVGSQTDGTKQQKQNANSSAKAGVSEFVKKKTGRKE